MTPSPRRPRRAVTAIPQQAARARPVGEMRAPPARDECEGKILRRTPADGDSEILSEVFDGVSFRQLADDEEVLSDEGYEN